MKRSLILILAGVIALLAGGAAALALLAGGDSSGRSSEPAVQAAATSTVAASPSPLPTSTPLPPTETPIPPTEPPQQPEPTNPLSTARAVATVPPAPTVPPQSDQPCAPPQVTVAADFSTGYYTVSGTTVDEINASLRANGPLVGGQKAVGVTSYRTRFSISSRCAKPDSCAIGTMRLDFGGSVTLPRHENPTALSPELLAAWRQFESIVSVHEGRHVTIVQEGAADIRRQMLELGPQVRCAELDYQVNRLWNLGLEAMERRQQAFHNADYAGQGGLVAR